MLLAIKTVDSHQPVIRLVAAATVSVRGQQRDGHRTDIQQVRRLANSDHHYFRKSSSSDNLIHVFLRGKPLGYVAVFVCRKSANLGMVLTKARMAMPELESKV
jgi:hypothetical protein